MSNIDLTVIFLCIVGASLSSTMIYEVMNEMSPLINENDLHVSQVKVIVRQPKFILFLELPILIWKYFYHFGIYIYGLIVI